MQHSMQNVAIKLFFIFQWFNFEIQPSFMANSDGFATMIKEMMMVKYVSCVFTCAVSKAFL